MATMTLELEPREGYLYACLSGDYSLPETKALSLQCLEACAQHHRSKLLLDVRSVQGSNSLTQIYEYAEFLAAEAIKVQRQAGVALRLVFVGRPPLLDPERFGITVARNRGLAAMSTGDIDEAYRWLGVEPPDQPAEEER
jgi:hypothetical protein